MKAEDTLQLMMDFDSEIFYNRQRCLDYLFCCVGNGYQWVNGELVKTDNSVIEDILSRWQLKEPIKKAKPRKDSVLIESVKKSMNDKLPLDDKWYPLSLKHSYIFNYPKDIKDDWWELICECRDMLIEDGIIK